jgi:predicted  nucleic acid-binding Zn-ribbon protein
VPGDLVLKILKEIRPEGTAFRKETRDNFGKVFHRLSTLESQGQIANKRLAALEEQMTDVRQRVGSLERHMVALLATMPATSERIDRLEARLAALEARAR